VGRAGEKRTWGMHRLHETHLIRMARYKKRAYGEGRREDGTTPSLPFLSCPIRFESGRGKGGGTAGSVSHVSDNNSYLPHAGDDLQKEKEKTKISSFFPPLRQGGAEKKNMPSSGASMAKSNGAFQFFFRLLTDDVPKQEKGSREAGALVREMCYFAAGRDLGGGKDFLGDVDRIERLREIGPGLVARKGQERERTRWGPLFFVRLKEKNFAGTARLLPFQLSSLSETAK